MVVVPQKTGWSGDSLADCPLHDGVRAVGEGGAVLSDGTVDEPEVLQWSTIQSAALRLHKYLLPAEFKLFDSIGSGRKYATFVRQVSPLHFPRRLIINEDMRNVPNLE